MTGKRSVCCGRLWCRKHTSPLTLHSSSILYSSLFFPPQTSTTTLMAMREILQRTGSLRMAQRPCHSLTSRPPCPLTSAHGDRMERPSHPRHQKGSWLGYDHMFECFRVRFELEEAVIKQSVDMNLFIIILLSGQDILHNIFCVSWRKESYTSLEWLRMSKCWQNVYFGWSNI